MKPCFAVDVPFNPLIFPKNSWVIALLKSWRLHATPLHWGCCRRPWSRLSRWMSLHSMLPSAPWRTGRTWKFPELEIWRPLVTLTSHMWQVAGGLGHFGHHGHPRDSAGCRHSQCHSSVESVETMLDGNKPCFCCRCPTRSSCWKSILTRNWWFLEVWAPTRRQFLVGSLNRGPWFHNTS